MRFSVSVSLALLLSGTGSFKAQTPARQPPATTRRFNELTLAGLRPGRDKSGKAIRLYGKPDSRSPDQQTLDWWFKASTGAFHLSVDLDKTDVVQFIRVSHDDGPHGLMVPRHSAFPIRAWESGRGLAVDTAGSRVTELYGEPDSRSPSTKDGRRLELLYYAFDWAGADVPQVMEVVCTAEDDGWPGRVVEITLAAPSL